MVRYVVQRPVAVLMCFSTLLITGLLLVKSIPVSLLPNVDVPEIVIQVNYPNTPSTILEQNIIRPMRESFSNINHLKNIETQASNHTGFIRLTFEYGTRMALAYIEANEKLDHLINVLPRDLERPRIMRVNTSDIPVIRVQVIPKPETDFIEASELTEKTLKKRLEQIDGVSMVDINGLQRSVITIVPDKNALKALNLGENNISETIKNANHDLGGLSVKDGQYRYFVKLSNSLESVNSLSQLPVKLQDNTTIPLNRLATIKPSIEKPVGFHLLNGKAGLVITVGKQANSKMNVLVPLIKKAVEEFKKEYISIDFYVTQDQSFLLDAGISNLYQDIAIGGALTIALLFLFLGNWALPTLMSINIPFSLILAFILFYVFNLSFNVISLSGLALGIGMLIDNSIVVIDNINRKHRTGLNNLESSVQGTNEVIAPVVSQVLTTVAVYAPLVLLNGMASSLVADQSIALTISLGVSLLVAFILSPLLYKLFSKSSSGVKDDTIFYKWVARKYHRMIDHILRHKLWYFITTLAIMPLGFFIVKQIPVSALPKIEKKESLVLIDWDDPIDAEENLRRIKDLVKVIQPQCEVTEAEIGIQQFLIQIKNNTIQNASIYYACKKEKEKWDTDYKIKQQIKNIYPAATVSIIDAPNAFTQLFIDNTPYLEARFKPYNQAGGLDDSYQGIRKIIQEIPYPYENGFGFLTQKNIDIILDFNKMATYNVSRASIEDRLQQLYGAYIISEIRHFGDVKTVRLQTGIEENKLNATVAASNAQLYPLSLFVTMHYAEQAKFVTADRGGEYRSIFFNREIKDVEVLKNTITRHATNNNFNVAFSGKYFENKEQVNQLWTIFWIVLFLLYIILAIQYEDLIQPLIVMLTIPLGIAGSMLLLWLTGSNLDVMACVGFVVILGLVVDDPTLKIEVLNRLDKEYKAKEYKEDNALLEKMIHEAGDICLKPLLLVSLTTSIAMVPVLFIGGIGNDLQKPLAYVIIGGLTIGTFFTTWFIPLAYWYVKKWRNKIN